jgi:hypothetical protein
MDWIRVSNDPFGRQIKKTLEHLQAHHARGTFGYSDLPSLDDDYRRQASEGSTLHQMIEEGIVHPDAEIHQIRDGVELSSDELAHDSVLTQLKGAALIETAGHKEFRLTKKGRKTTVQVAEL